MRARAPQGGSELQRVLGDVYSACDETSLGVSVTELEQRLSNHKEACKLLEAAGVYHALLHELEIGR